MCVCVSVCGCVCGWVGWLWFLPNVCTIQNTWCASPFCAHGRYYHDTSAYKRCLYTTTFIRFWKHTTITQKLHPDTLMWKKITCKINTFYTKSWPLGCTPHTHTHTHMYSLATCRKANSIYHAQWHPCPVSHKKVSLSLHIVHAGLCVCMCTMHRFFSA